jgi:hypothetical protein
MAFFVSFLTKSVMALVVYLKMNFNFRPMFGGSTECDLMDGDGGMCDKKVFPPAHTTYLPPPRRRNCEENMQKMREDDSIVMSNSEPNELHTSCTRSHLLAINPE